MPGPGYSDGFGPSGSISGTFQGRSLANFNFSAKADSVGFSITVSFDTPESFEAPEWDRRLIVLRKQGEWPKSWDDADTVTIVNALFPTGGSHEYVDSDLVAGQTYYYGLFELRTDGYWVHDEKEGRRSAYPYDRWGCDEYMFKSMPRGIQSSDVDDDGDLEEFLFIFGALFDNIKTDTENLLTLFSVDEVHIELLPLIDAKIGYPTWWSANGIKQRQETSRAISLYKILGGDTAYQQLLEQISQWEAVVVEGWRYVLFTNGLYGSTLPDTTDPDLISRVGRIDDKLKYVNDNDGWHSVSGLGFFMYEIPGVSDAISQAMINRMWEMILWAKASYVNPNLALVPMDEDTYPMTWVTDEWDVDFDLLTYTSPPLALFEEDLGYTTSSASLFQTNDTGSVTNDLTDRLFHEALEYI